MSTRANDETAGRPGAEAPDKPESITDISRPSWTHTLKRSLREFSADQLIDKAAALTYFAVLSVFPALVVLVSMLGVVGQGQATTTAILDLLRENLPEETVTQLEGPITNITENQAAGLGLVIGIVVALWTASNYVNAFSRAMNGIYGVAEGRPMWKLRPIMYVLTAGLIVLVGVAALILAVSGPVARWVGDLVGLGGTAVTVWGYAKWPVLVVIVVVVIALLYYVTPNVRLPRLRWVSPGALLAVVVAAVATAGLGFYVANFGRYDRTYGALAGVIIFLLWLWIMNLVLLLGAELDAEVERSRELQAGIAAEEDIRLPPRDTAKIEKDAARERRLVEEAREIRRRAAGEPSRR